MGTYRVVWEIDVEAANHVEAAKGALKVMQDRKDEPDSATVFDVKGPDWKGDVCALTIDLAGHLPGLLRLFLVCHDDGADNFDLFVRAYTEQGAVELWQGEFGRDDKPARVIEVPAASAGFGTVPWPEVRQHFPVKSEGVSP